MRRKKEHAERLNPGSDPLVQIPAQDAEIGGTYLSRTGLRVIVKERTDEWVIVHSLTTGHDVEIASSYPLTQDGQE